MKHFSIAAAVLVCTLSIGGAISHTDQKGACQEDQACWNCLTMGNHTCGPQQLCISAPEYATTNCKEH
jgi:hypothetical protein